MVKDDFTQFLDGVDVLVKRKKDKYYERIEAYGADSQRRDFSDKPLLDRDLQMIKSVLRGEILRLLNKYFPEQ